MAAFNYRDLIRQVPPRSWQFYFQARGMGFQADGITRFKVKEI